MVLTLSAVLHTKEGMHVHHISLIIMNHLGELYSSLKAGFVSSELKTIHHNVELSLSGFIITGLLCIFRTSNENM